MVINLFAKASAKIHCSKAVEKLENPSKQSKGLKQKISFMCGMFELIEHDKYGIKWQKRKKIQTNRYSTTRKKNLGVIGRHSN